MKVLSALRSTPVLWLILSLGASFHVAASEPSEQDRNAAVRQWVTSAFTRTSKAAVKHDRMVVLQRSHKILANRTVWDTPIQLGDHTFEHGLYMDAPAAVRVQLTRPAASFSATVGIDNNQSTKGNPEAGSVRFHVEVDGRIVFSTPVIRLTDEPVHLEVPLEDATGFVLRVDDGGNGRGWDQCSWANAVVTFADSSTTYLDELPLGQPRSAAPFSFTVDGEHCDSFLNKCRRGEQIQELPGKTLQTYRYDSPDTGLVFEFVVTTYDTVPAVDWVCYVENQGEGLSPIIENLLPVNVDLPMVSSMKPMTLRWSQGDANCADAFLPHDDPLPAGQSRQFHAHGGRSSNGSGGGVLPFFNVHDGQTGWVVAVGWSGQWQAEFSRDKAGQLTLLAGMELTRFRLKPHERVRTPRIVLLRYEDAEMIAGHNAFRQLMLRHYWQQAGDQPAIPPICHNTAATVYRSGKPATEANQLAIISKATELGCEAYWMDAYWYPQPWHANVGNWFPRPEDFPRGLRPLSDAAHRSGMSFVLWFEPERVRPETYFDENSSALTIQGSDDRLYPLDNSGARGWLTHFLNGRLELWNVDVFRNDFNLNPLPYWHANDEANEQGLTEMHYVDGLYRMWDELRAHNAGLTIDNCASGGRRIDIELCSRSYPLWRSDFNDIGQGLKGKEHWPRMGRASQVHVGGLSLYVPLHAGPLWSVAPYNVRSCMSGSVVLYDWILDEGFSDELARQGIAEVKQLRPYFLGDYYPLMELTAEQSDWWAYQLHRPDHEDGIVLAFRRPDSKQTTATVSLRDIHVDWEYEVSITGETYEREPYQAVHGDRLKELLITIEDQPGSTLIRYRRRKAPLDGTPLATQTWNRPVRIDAFVSPTVPESHEPIRERLLAMLGEIGELEKVDVRIHPTESFSDEAAWADQRFGIAPAKLDNRDSDDDAPRYVMMAVALTCGLETNVIQPIQPWTDVEYELVRTLVTMNEDRKRTVGVLKTDARVLGREADGTIPTRPKWPVVTELEKWYRVVDVDPANSITEPMDVLLAVQPSSLGPPQMVNSVKVVEQGQPTAIFEDPFPFAAEHVPGTDAPRIPPGGPQALMMGQRAEPKGDITPLWSLLGVDFRRDVVWQDFNPFPELENLPKEFVILNRSLGHRLPCFNPRDPTTRSRERLLFPFPGAISRISTTTDFVPLVRTGTLTGYTSTNGIAPMRLFGKNELNENRRQVPTRQPYVLAARVRGRSSGSVGTSGSSEHNDAPPELSAAIVCDVDMLHEKIVSIETRTREQELVRFDNLSFALDVVDSLAGEERFADLRRYRAAGDGDLAITALLPQTEAPTPEELMTREEMRESVQREFETAVTQESKRLQVGLDRMRHQLKDARLPELHIRQAVATAEEIRDTALELWTMGLRRKYELQMHWLGRPPGAVPPPEGHGFPDVRGTALWPAPNAADNVGGLLVVEGDDKRMVRARRTQQGWLPTSQGSEGNAERFDAIVAAMADLVIDRVVSESRIDHGKYSVAGPDLGDPLMKASDKRTRLQLTSPEGDELLHLVIGDPVPDQSGYHYVRLFGQIPVYVVRLETELLAPNSSDWPGDEASGTSSE